MAYGSGLSGQLGYAEESSYGTAVSVDHFAEFLSEKLNKDITYIDSAGIKSGQAYKRGSRTVQSRSTISGDFSMEAADKGMGLLLKHALGTPAPTPTAISASTAYKTIFVPGSKAGFSLTAQVGRPQTDATVKAFTYSGVKISKWEFTCSDNEMAQFSFDVDGRSQSTETALATATYTADTGVFAFSDVADGALQIGGTASTVSGETTVTGGTAVNSLIKGVTITGETPMATERFGLGNAGLKGEPIENDTPTITGSFDTEFTSQAEFYDFYNTGTRKALQIPFAHGDAGGGNPFTLAFLIPMAIFKEASVNVDGPDIVGQTVNWEAYDDGVNPPIQITTIGSDSVL